MHVFRTQTCTVTLAQMNLCKVKCSLSTFRVINFNYRVAVERRRGGWANHIKAYNFVLAPQIIAKKQLLWCKENICRITCNKIQTEFANILPCFLTFADVSWWQRRCRRWSSRAWRCDVIENCAIGVILNDVGKKISLLVFGDVGRISS